MDPNACLSDIFDALSECDCVTAAERAEDLREWLGNGGFCPGGELLRRSSVDAFLRLVTQMITDTTKEE